MTASICSPTPSTSPARWSTSPVGVAATRADRRRRRGGAARRSAAWRSSRSATRCSPAPTSGRPQRVVLAGHLDTVPIADNVPSRADGDGRPDVRLRHVDMKSGDAVVAAPGRRRCADAARTTSRSCSTTARRSSAARNGLGRVERERPRAGCRATSRSCCEPTDGVVEAGCQGTLRVAVPHQRPPGAHGPVLARATTRSTRRRRCSPARGVRAARRSTSTAASTARGSTRSGITGGVAGNVIPDECVVEVNFRFAPDRTEEQAADARARGVRRASTSESTDSAAGARCPGLDARRPREFLAAVGRPPRQARLDGRGPVRRAGHPGAQLRPGRPEPRAHAGRARRRRSRSPTSRRVLRGYLSE